jgi:hypothetical protein
MLQNIAWLEIVFQVVYHCQSKMWSKYQISGIATKDFLGFKGESKEKVRSQIGKVCSLAAKGIQFGQQDHEDDANVGGDKESGSSDNENFFDY